MTNKKSNDENAPSAEGTRAELSREYSTAPDHVTVYSDHVNVVSTGTEVIVSVYQTIPGYPNDPKHALSSRRATVIMSPEHAQELGRLLTKHAKAMKGRGTK